MLTTDQVDKSVEKINKGRAYLKEHLRASGTFRKGERITEANVRYLAHLRDYTTSLEESVIMLGKEYNDAAVNFNAMLSQCQGVTGFLVEVQILIDDPDLRLTAKMRRITEALDRLGAQLGEAGGGIGIQRVWVPEGHANG